MMRTAVAPDERAQFVLRPRASPLRHYAVFGGVLQSTLPFPDLRETVSQRPDWTLTVAPEPAPATEAVFLGERSVGTERYRLTRTPAGLRLDYSHAGSFDISNGGREIVWHPSDDPSVELARSIILGPVLALALEAAGCLCLHGSGVAIRDRAVAFLAPKHHGKSTLALALTASGARLISDDMLAVQPGPPAMVRPGTASVRVWEDSAQLLESSRLCASTTHGTKITMSGFAPASVVYSPVALESIYLLTPVVAATAPRPIARMRLPAAASAVALAKHAKVPDSLAGLDAAAGRLHAAAEIAANVPVYALYVARDFDRLPEVVQQIERWHGGSGPDPREHRL